MDGDSPLPPLRLSTMASPPKLAVLLLAAFSLASIHLCHCQTVRGSVSCLDCSNDHLLSGIRVGVKCSHGGEPKFAVTDEKGSFQALLPRRASPSFASPCLVRLLGGAKQICAHKKNMVSRIIRAKQGSSPYTLSTPLIFSTKCRPSAEGSAARFGSSKTVDLPLPPEWGFPPTSYYFYPFVPIIGIP